VRGAFDEPLDKLLSDGVMQLCALVDAVSDARLLQVERVVFDDEVLGSLLTATPTALADIATRLRTGAPVKELLAGGRAPGEIEQHLRELARRGAVLEVRGSEGEDLVAIARRAREEHPGQLLHGGQRLSPVPGVAAELHSSAKQWVRPRREVIMPASAAPPPPPPLAIPPVAVQSLPEPAHEPAAVQSPPEPAHEPEPAQARPNALRPSTPPPSTPASRPPEAFRIESVLLQGQPKSVRPRAPNPGSLRPPPPQVRPAQGGVLGLALTLSALVAAGFFGWRMLRPRLPRSGTTISALSTARHADPVPTREPATNAAPQADAPAVLQERPPPDAGLLPQGSTRALPYIDRSYGVAVPPEQGLLVVELTSPVIPPQVRVGGRDLGKAPIAVALPGGRHELMLKRGGHTSFRYVVLRPGETRVFQVRE
jgi:hypothetical protein